MCKAQACPTPARLSSLHNRVRVRGPELSSLRNVRVRGAQVEARPGGWTNLTLRCDVGTSAAVGAALSELLVQQRAPGGLAASTAPMHVYTCASG